MDDVTIHDVDSLARNVEWVVFGKLQDELEVAYVSTSPNFMAFMLTKLTIERKTAQPRNGNLEETPQPISFHCHSI